jgi:5-hydroxyisourate hydrolase
MPVAAPVRSRSHGLPLATFSLSLRDEVRYMRNKFESNRETMSAITTHVLDTSRGKPASGVSIILEIQTAEHGWQELGRGRTDSDGRLRDLLAPDFVLQEGVYRLTFETAGYFATQNISSFYPQVAVVFRVQDAAQHYHVPLLLNPFGYSTYRGS